MTTVSVNPLNHQDAVRAEEMSAGKRAKRSVGRKVCGVLAGTAVAAAAAVTLASSAEAAYAPTSMPPTFECYSNSINVDSPSFQPNNGYITWEPEVDVFNGSTWVVAAYGPAQTVNTNDTFSRTLGSSPVTFNAAHGRYFKVEDWFSVNGGASWYGYQQDQAMRDQTSTYVCQTSY